MYHASLEQGLTQLGIAYTPAMIDQLVRYAQLLLKWNKVYNLTAICHENEVITHHLLDSATFVPWVEKLVPGARRVLDVGSGGGLPSIPLAILRPELDVTAVDCVNKKTAFLIQAGIELGLKNYRVKHARVQTLPETFEVISCRAFASLVDFTSWSEAQLAPDGHWLAMKGVYPEDELAALSACPVSVKGVYEINVPGLEAQRHIVDMVRSSM